MRMFCGELDGELQRCHIASRADTVRQAICRLWSFVDIPPEYRWKYARRAGWRVVPVFVKKVQKYE
jgi:hypothetical protein